MGVRVNPCHQAGSGTGLSRTTSIAALGQFWCAWELVGVRNDLPALENRLKNGISLGTVTLLWLQGRILSFRGKGSWGASSTQGDL